jgi:hypothetical protein
MQTKLRLFQMLIPGSLANLLFAAAATVTAVVSTWRRSMTMENPTFPRSRPVAVATLSFAAIFCSAQQLMATVILPHLPAGSTYELMFVTSNTIQATSKNISDYNSFVSLVASDSPPLVALSATWHAVASTGTTNASVNAPDNGIDVYNTQGMIVVGGASGIYSGSPLSNSVQYDEFGTSEVGAVWTGSSPLGQAVSGHALGSSHPTLGDMTSTNPGTWIDSAQNLSDVNFEMYALSSPITVTPEPGTISLLISALVVFGGVRFLRRHRCHRD